jgi:hypothetical protein
MPRRWLVLKLFRENSPTRPEHFNLSLARVCSKPAEVAVPSLMIWYASFKKGAPTNQSTFENSG